MKTNSSSNFHVTSFFKIKWFFSLSFLLTSSQFVSTSSVLANPSHGQIKTQVVSRISKPKNVLNTLEEFNFDFDDNIFITNAKLKLWDTEKHVPVEISTSEFAIVRDKLGREGAWKNVVAKPESFENFGDKGPDGVHAIEKQVEDATSASPSKWKGPAWNLFVKALSDPKTRAKTGIITARQHAPSSIYAALKVLKQKGLIPALPPEERVFSVGWPELQPQYRAATHAESKAKVMISLLDALEKEPVLSAFPKLATPGEKPSPYTLHHWGFADDDFGNISKAESLLEPEVNKKRWPHVELAIYFTGQNHPTEKPRVDIIEPTGELRHEPAPTTQPL